MPSFIKYRKTKFHRKAWYNINFLLFYAKSLFKIAYIIFTLFIDNEEGPLSLNSVNNLLNSDNFEKITDECNKLSKNVHNNLTTEDKIDSNTTCNNEMLSHEGNKIKFVYGKMYISIYYHSNFTLKIIYRFT